MPTVQANFPTRQDAYTVGQAVDSRYHSDSGPVETAGGIPFAAPVMRGTQSDRGLALFAAGGGAFLGIAKLDHGVPSQSGQVNGYPANTIASYFTSGAGVAVTADAAVAIDAVVRYNTATGRYTSAAASGTVLECTGWTFRTTGTAAGQTVVIGR
jgi:hypothetical protein